MPLQDAIYLLRSLLGLGAENERTKAIVEMNGAHCSSRPMRIGVATPKNHLDINSSTLHKDWYWLEVVDMQMVPLPKVLSLMIFVGGLDSDVNEEDLRQPFSQFGEVVSVKIPVGKACGFVQFANRKDAENAMNMLNATVIGKQTVRLPWCRSHVEIGLK